MIVYMIGMAIISYLSSFGGRGVMPFGVDFIVMAIFTIIIYGIAGFLMKKTKAIEGML